MGYEWESIQVFTGHEGGIISVCFSTDGEYILTGSRDNSACLWDMNGNQIQNFIGNSWIYSSPEG